MFGLDASENLHVCSFVCVCVCVAAETRSPGSYKWFQSALITSVLSHWMAGNDLAVKHFCRHRHKVLIQSNAEGQRSGPLLCCANLNIQLPAPARSLSIFQNGQVV